MSLMPLMTPTSIISIAPPISNFNLCSYVTKFILIFITVCKRSCGKVKFLHLSVSYSVHRGGLPQCMLGYPPWQRHPNHPRADGHCSGRYASYWNAFLLLIFSQYYFVLENRISVQMGPAPI